MSENVSIFKWTDERARAALLVAEDELSDIQIAQKVDITDRTLYRWKEHPDFQARVKQHIADLEASIKRFAIAKKRNRVGRQNADWLRLQQIREERAGNPAMGGVPGDETGLMIRQFKVIGTGMNAQTIEEYVVDTGLVKAQSELEKQAAGEVGDDPPVRLRHGGDPDNPTPIRSESNVVIFIPATEEVDIDGDDDGESPDPASP
jgi:transposase-like protein